MFAYCLCNPINLVDRDGKTAEALQVWTASMWWLCAADTILPIGDIVYGAGIIILAATATHIASKDNNHTSQLPKTSTIVNSTPQNPQPNKNDDDDDDDDDYYDDDSNFGGREKIGKKRGNTPGSNQAQNKQFKDATRGLPKGKQKQIHDLITKRGYGYEDIVEIAKWFR